MPSAKLTWAATAAQQPTTWLAEYWNTPGADEGSGDADQVRRMCPGRRQRSTTAGGSRSPAPGIASDHFVARWTRVMSFGGRYLCVHGDRR